MNRRSRNINLPIFVLILLSAFLFSCSNERRIAKGKPLKNHAPGFLVKNNEKNDFEYDWLGMKLSVDVSSEGKKDSFKATIRSRKDSVIWISISPALGVEMVRVMITPDSVKYISKVPNNKHYYLGDFSVIGEVAQMPLDFNMIQQILVGNAIMMDKGEDKFISTTDEQQYVLISKFHRKLKKVLSFDEKRLLPNSMVTVNPQSREYRKMSKRATLDELMLKRFWLNGYDYKVEKALFNDLLNLRDIEIRYSDFKVYEGQSYPSKASLKMTSREEWQQIDFKISRIRTSKAYDFPFEIPENYERRY